jgi:hypothetical protein
MPEHLTPLNAERLFELAGRYDLGTPATDAYTVSLAAARAAMGATPGQILPAFRLYAKGSLLRDVDGRQRQVVTISLGNPGGAVLLGSWTRSDLSSVNAALFINLGDRLERIYGLR